PEPFEFWRVWLWGVPAALIVGGCLWLERQERVPSLPALAILGDASYSIYLAHAVAITALWNFWMAANLRSDLLGELMFIATAIGAGILLGLALYVLVEKPITNLMRRARVPRVVTSWVVGLASR